MLFNVFIVTLDRICVMENTVALNPEVHPLVNENSTEMTIIIYTQGSVVHNLRSPWASTAQNGWETIKEDVARLL